MEKNNREAVDNFPFFELDFTKTMSVRNGVDNSIFLDENVITVIEMLGFNKPREFIENCPLPIRYDLAFGLSNKNEVTKQYCDLVNKIYNTLRVYMPWSQLKISSGDTLGIDKAFDIYQYLPQDQRSDTNCFSLIMASIAFEVSKSTAEGSIDRILLVLVMYLFKVGTTFTLDSVPINDREADKKSSYLPIVAGLNIIAGPSNSGKSTMMRYLDSASRLKSCNILAAEPSPFSDEESAMGELPVIISKMELDREKKFFVLDTVFLDSLTSLLKVTSQAAGAKGVNSMIDLDLVKINNYFLRRGIALIATLNTSMSSDLAVAITGKVSSALFVDGDRMNSDKSFILSNRSTVAHRVERYISIPTKVSRQIESSKLLSAAIAVNGSSSIASKTNDLSAVDLKSRFKNIIL